jgi:hypothetical protein
MKQITRSKENTTNTNSNWSIISLRASSYKRNEVHYVYFPFDFFSSVSKVLAPHLIPPAAALIYNEQENHNLS